MIIIKNVAPVNIAQMNYLFVVPIIIILILMFYFGKKKDKMTVKAGSVNDEINTLVDQINAALA